MRLAVRNPTYRDYQPLSICPAEPGWRAIYLLDPSEQDPGWCSTPLIAWVVYRVVTRPCIGSKARETEENRIVGAYLEDNEILFVEEVSNFWCYRSPTDPDPTPDEADRQRNG